MQVDEQSKKWLAKVLRRYEDIGCGIWPMLWLRCNSDPEGIVCNNKPITAARIASELHKSEQSIKRQLGELAEKPGLIRRTWCARQGYRYTLLIV